ncbi:MAG: DUF3109 family protein [Prevotellaceae bacterium]|jgi:hypothetical protein|nr:DUF3109 family protein [Prevotellaceae bacterium]
MIQIDDKIISHDIFEKYFTCDLSKCLGICCVHGDSGAPLEEEEKDLIEKYIDKIKPYLTSEGISVIEQCGTATIDFDGELVTPLVRDSEECAYSYFSSNGTCLCGIEKAYRNGDIPFNKPISCHLYPIRIRRFGDLTALNYDQWHICSSARDLGKKEKTPVFMFLKEPITRKFGEKFFDALMEIWEQEIEDFQD